MFDIYNINYINIVAILVVVLFITLMIYMFSGKIEYNPNNIDKFVNSLKTEKIKVKDYEIVKFFDVLTEEECNNIINGAKNDLKDSIVYTNNFTKQVIDKNIRISKTAWLIKDNSNNSLRNVIEKLENITSFITKKPIVNQENIQIVNYEKGGYYNPHYDACSSLDINSKINMNGPYGQRIYTFLIYLNDNIDGGSTYFPKIDKHIMPKKGMGILFKNIHENNSDFHELSQHTGTIIKKGEKWICNIWVRENNFKNNNNVKMCYCPNCNNDNCYNVAKLKGEKICKILKCENEECPNYFLKNHDCLCPHCDNKYCKSKLRTECVKPNCTNQKCLNNKMNIQNKND